MENGVCIVYTAAADDDNSIYGENGKFVVVLTFNFGKFTSVYVCIWRLVFVYNKCIQQKGEDKFLSIRLGDVG